MNCENCPDCLCVYESKEDERYWEVWKVSRNMKKHGGSFVQRLGDALSFADKTNAEKIKNAFPEFWKEYKELKNE